MYARMTSSLSRVLGRCRSAGWTPGLRNPRDELVRPEVDDCLVQMVPDRDRRRCANDWRANGCPGTRPARPTWRGSLSFTSGKYAPAGNLLLCSMTSNVVLISSAVSGSSGLTAAVVVAWATACRVKAGVPLTMPAPASADDHGYADGRHAPPHARADGLGRCRVEVLHDSLLLPRLARSRTGSAPQVRPCRYRGNSHSLNERVKRYMSGRIRYSTKRGSR